MTTAISDIYSLTFKKEIALKGFSCAATSIILFLVLSTTANAKDYVGGNFRLKAPLDESKSYCFDLFGFGPTVDLAEPVAAHTCKNEGWRDATFTVDYPEQGQIYSPDYGLCLEAANHVRVAHLFMKTCSDSELQRFIYRENQTLEVINSNSTAKNCVVVHPASIAIGGAGHLRREIYMLPCALVKDLELAQWLLPESGEGLAEPENSSVDSSVQAITQSADVALYIRSCSRCHGQMAEGIEAMQAPKLAGLSAAYLARQFHYFLSGVRGGNENERWASQMTHYVSEMSQSQIALIDDVSTYIESMDDVVLESTLEGNVVKGEQIYQANCVLCHGESGMGIDSLNAPKLAGMSDWYLFRQMQKFRDGRRGDSSEDQYGALMVPSAKALKDEQEVKDVIAYINALRK